jgi:hypothetical protein
MRCHHYGRSCPKFFDPPNLAVTVVPAWDPGSSRYLGISSSSGSVSSEIPSRSSKVDSDMIGSIPVLTCFSGEIPSLIEDALSILRAVFQTIPTFWGTSELASVFRLYFDTLALGSTNEISSFARHVASKAPTAVLLSTYFETWPSVSGAQTGVSCRFFSGFLRFAQSHPL